jgi:hypothetical protein
VRAAILLMLVSGCSAVAAPRTTETPPAPFFGAGEATPAPRVLDAMREQIFCHGRCPPPPPPDLSDVELTLKRSERAFAVEVRLDGTVVFEGWCSCEARCRVVEHIPPADAQALVHDFETAGVKLDSNVHSCVGFHVDDAPFIASISLVRGRRTLTMSHHCNPEVVARLAREIDQVTHADRRASCAGGSWAGCNGP